MKRYDVEFDTHLARWLLHYVSEAFVLKASTKAAALEEARQLVHAIDAADTIPASKNP